MSVITPVAAAIVYVMNERRKAKADKKQEELDEAERERSYSERLSNRLKSAEETIERIKVQNGIEGYVICNRQGQVLRRFPSMSQDVAEQYLSLIHISEPTRPY